MLKRRPQAPGDAREVSERALRTVGEELRAAREARGEELQDIAAYLRIRPAYLTALERGNVAAIPGRTYAVGFLRSYGNYLGLDGGLLVISLRPAVEAATPVRPSSQREPLNEDRRPTFAVMTASLLLAGALYGGYHLFATDRADPPLVAEAPVAIPLPTSSVVAEPHAAVRLPLALAESEPAPAADVTSAVAAETPAAADATPDSLVSPEGDQPASSPAAADAVVGRVVLLARDTSWIQVRSADRTFVRTRTLQAGERFVAPERDDLVLFTGNAGGLEILLDGHSIGPVGAPGAVVKDLSLAPNSLQRRAAGTP